ncbi:hypothetical protein HI914_05386 [Erysiphe necator]|nr:hypothetical protein HI914_05386 [Erysiphe necator]
MDRIELTADAEKRPEIDAKEKATNSIFKIFTLKRLFVSLTNFNRVSQQLFFFHKAPTLKNTPFEIFLTLVLKHAFVCESRNDGS